MTSLWANGPALLWMAMSVGNFDQATLLLPPRAALMGTSVHLKPLVPLPTGAVSAINPTAAQRIRLQSRMPITRGQRLTLCVSQDDKRVTTFFELRY